MAENTAPAALPPVAVEIRAFHAGGGLHPRPHAIQATPLADDSGESNVAGVGAWLMTVGEYADTAQLEVYVGDVEGAGHRAAALTVERAQPYRLPGGRWTRHPADMVAVRAEAIAVHVDREALAHHAAE